MAAQDRRADLVPADKLDPGIPKGMFSHSQYGSYVRCGRAYEFSYVQGIKSPPAGVMFKGQMVHRGAEEAHRHIIKHKTMPALEMVRAVVSDAFDTGVKETELIEWDEGETPGRAKDTALASYGVYHVKALPRVRPVAAEQAFVLYLDSTPVIGFIDLIDREAEPIIVDGEEDPGHLIVSDLKVSKAAWSQADIDKDTQFTLYSKVTGIAKVRVDNIVQHKAGPDFKQQSGTRDSHDHGVVLEHMVEVINLIKKGVFPMTAIDSWGCSARWCGYWGMCRGKRT